MKTVIVIPTYNERENIGQLIEDIFALKVNDLELVTVDDASPDGTQEIIKIKQQKYPIHLIVRAGKMGLGSAYVAGFRKALELEADYIGEMDADFSHDPKDIAQLLSAIGEADLVIGSRRIAGGKIIGWNFRRHLFSLTASLASRLLLGLKAKDVTAGFRFYRASVLKQINLDQIKSQGFAFQEEVLKLVQKAGFRIIEIPVTFVDRRQGQSKLNKKDIWELGRLLLRLN